MSESETLQNITDQFVPLMANFRIFFFWEQEKTNLRFKREHIVDEASAAPMVDNTERCGVAADHREMVRFGDVREQGFRTVVAALRRYVVVAPDVVRERCVRARQALDERRRFEALEMLRGVQLMVPETGYDASSFLYLGERKDQKSIMGDVSGSKDVLGSLECDKELQRVFTEKSFADEGILKKN